MPDVTWGADSAPITYWSQNHQFHQLQLTPKVEMALQEAIHANGRPFGTQAMLLACDC